MILHVFGFGDFPVEVVVSELGGLVAKGNLKKEGDEYVVVNLPAHRDYEELRLPLIKDFLSRLRRTVKDYDPFDYEGIEEMIDKSISSLSGAMIPALGNKKLPDLTFAAEGLRNAILAPWTVDSPKLAEAGNLFLEFLSSESPSAIALVSAIYETCLTVDLLSQGRRMEDALKDAPAPDCVLVDTNCLSAALCSSNKYHDVVTSSFKLANRFGFSIGYSPRTRNEFEGLIQAANRIIREGDLVEGALRNELVLEFTRQKGSGRWSDRMTELEMWHEWVKQKYRMTEINLGFLPNPSEKQQIFQAAFQIILNSHRDRREAEALWHDVNLYGLLQARKENVKQGLFNSPLIETLDRYFWETDTLLVNVKGYPAAVVHATQWLNTLAQFVDATFEDQDVQHVAHAILRNLIEPFEPSLSINEYAKLLAERYDYEPEQAELLAKVLTQSVFRSELTKALQESNADQVAAITQRIFDDGKVIDAIVGRQQAEAEATSLRNRMHQMGHEIAANRRIIQYLREVSSRPVQVVVSIAEVQDKEVYLLERLIEDIEQKVPDIAKSEGISKEMLQVKDEGGFRRALSKIEGALQRVGSDVVAAQTLLSVANQISGFISGGS